MNREVNGIMNDWRGAGFATERGEAQWRTGVCPQPEEISGGVSASAVALTADCGRIGDGAGSGESDWVRLAKSCAELTLGELQQDGLLNGICWEEVKDSYTARLDAREEDEPIPDVLLFLAQKQTENGEDALLAEVDRLAGILLHSGRRRKVVRCPFLHLTRTPSIYREIPSVLQFCRMSMIPVVQAHEKELVTLAAINPVSASRAMEVVVQLIEDASGRRPIPAMVMAPAAHWRQLNRKHFGL